MVGTHQVFPSAGKKGDVYARRSQALTRKHQAEGRAEPKGDRVEQDRQDPTILGQGA
jgi:hypothetical protein